MMRGLFQEAVGAPGLWAGGFLTSWDLAAPPGSSTLVSLGGGRARLSGLG